MTESAGSEGRRSTADVRRSRRVGWAGALLALSGCVIQSENISHSVRAVGYPGYAIEYSEAEPSPGTPVTEGARVTFRVTVRYVLQSHETGILQLMFRNERDADVLPPAAAIPIKREGWQRATLVHEVQIPPGAGDLMVTIPVLPDGATSSYGMLRLRYPLLRR